MPQLYEFKLHESPVLEGNNYERFDLEWVLDVSSISSSSLEEFSPSSIQPGDILYIPELVTGAGEFEAMRFVGKPVPDAEQHLLPLLVGGVEYPEFPPEIVAIHNESNLKEAYASMFDAMLKRMTGGPDTLKDIMGGGDAEIDEYWSSPPTTRPKERDSTEKWIIPLEKCQVKNVAVQWL